MITTYYDYEKQVWKYDRDGFISFHTEQLEFLKTELSFGFPQTEQAIKHHQAMIDQANPITSTL